jgi:selenocysteine lyase/cysteine desulfurase
MIDIERARADTPAVQSLVHLNNAGASLMPAPVTEAMLDYLRSEAALGGYETARLYHPALERVYTAAAELLNAQPDEIAFVENATRAWDLVFYSLPFAPGDRIITAHAEYSSNFIAMLQVQRRKGVEIVVVPDDPSGQLDLQALEAAIDRRTKLIAITHMPSTGGLVNPAEAVGQIARRYNVLYLLDACQSVGQRVLDVQAIQCDFLSVTGRKFLRGPRGTGLLYVRRERIADVEPVLLDTHAATWTARDAYTIRADARRFENWEQNVVGKIGLGVAIDYALGWGMAAVQQRVQYLAEALRRRLLEVPGISITDQGTERSGIVTFVPAAANPQRLRDALGAAGINVSVSPREYTLLDFEARALPDLVRASVHYYNTEQELNLFVERLMDLLARGKI